MNKIEEVRKLYQKQTKEKLIDECVLLYEHVQKLGKEKMIRELSDGLNVKRIEKKPGMVNMVGDWLYRLEDIQKAMGELGLADHNDKLFDILTGFPNKEDKTIGEVLPERKLMVNVKATREKDGKTLSDTTYRTDKDKMTIVEEKENDKT